MNRHKIAVLGSTGQLGTDLVEVLRRDESFEPLPLSHSECDCTNLSQLTNVICDLNPDAVINCAAYVQVDDCEDHAREAFEINTIGALNVAKACAEASALCVYVSTDYVFDGAKNAPYVESDATSPINTYGTSKLAGEYLIRQAAPRWLIVRLASLFGKTGARAKGGNFVETVIKQAKASKSLRVVNDIMMSPTYTRDASEAVTRLLRDKATGLFHVTNSGACTWYEFAKAILDLTGTYARIVPVSSNEFPRRARRPINSALRSERLIAKSRAWQDGLKAYLIETGHVPPRS